jgi:DNA-directed RNA polymerase specialized sigma24 family protein
VNQSAAAEQGPRLLALYDRAFPQVYGYLVSRVSDAAVAEDLTAETFPAAVRAVREDKVPDLTIAWLVAVARHKLVDHWHRAAREERNLRLASDPGDDVVDDGRDAPFDRERTHEVLGQLGAHHQRRADVALPRRPLGTGDRRTSRSNRARDRGAPDARGGTMTDQFEADRSDADPFRALRGADRPARTSTRICPRAADTNAGGSGSASASGLTSTTPLGTTPLGTIPLGTTPLGTTPLGTN